MIDTAIGRCPRHFHYRLNNSEIFSNQNHLPVFEAYRMMYDLVVYIVFKKALRFWVTLATLTVNHFTTLSLLICLETDSSMSYREKSFVLRYRTDLLVPCVPLLIPKAVVLSIFQWERVKIYQARPELQARPDCLPDLPCPDLT